jgi:hypothetical protein
MQLSDDNAMYMWHYRMGHVGVKRMKKLHKDGLLASLDFDSFDTYESCLMGKMTKTPFTGLVERVMTHKYRGLIRPICITILYHNLLLFIDVFHI